MVRLRARSSATPDMYKSDAQRRFFHSPGAKRAGISKKTVGEFDRASKGKKLPEKKKVRRYT